MKGHHLVRERGGTEKEAGIFINNSRQRLADNLPLSVRFNPLKDLKVH